MSSSETSLPLLNVGTEDAGADCWVFAYGSLMWDWPWPALDRRKAFLDGYQRSMCLASVVYRGTPEFPGAGLGLIPGGRCAGLAFKVCFSHWPDVSRALDERELVSGVYRRISVPVALDRVDGAIVRAVCYVSRDDHPQYLRDVTESELAYRIAFARGKAGQCMEYVQRTCDSMRALDIVDESLFGLSERARQLTHAASAIARNSSHE